MKQNHYLVFKHCKIKINICNSKICLNYEKAIKLNYLKKICPRIWMLVQESHKNSYESENNNTLK